MQAERGTVSLDRDADGYPYATRVPQTKAAGDGGVKDG